MKIGEVIKEITTTQHKLAVLESVIEYIENFLPSDTGEAEVFFVSEPCLEPEVPAEVVEEVLESVTKIQAEHVARLEKLEGMETKDVKPRAKRSPRRSKKPATKS